MITGEMVRAQRDSSEGRSAVGGVAERMMSYVAAYKPLLHFPEQRDHLGHMIRGLTSDLERKSSEPIAVMLGLPRRLLQNFVGMSKWEWEPLRRQQRIEVRAEIGIEDGMLIIDPSSVPKKGKETVGVARQWCGRLGKIDNCVVGVHAAYVGLDGQAALVDSQLYLPEAWSEDMWRRDKVHVPEDVVFSTKVDMGTEMVKRLATELPFKWVTADEEYGRSAAFRDAIRELKKWYVIEVPRNTFLRARTGVGSAKSYRIDRLAALVKPTHPPAEILVAYGEKQPIVVQAFMVPVFTSRHGGIRADETMLCTTDASGDEHFYLAHAPDGADLTTLVRRAGTRHRVEEVFAEAKGEVGMDHYECRAWHGWHHHMTLVQIAHWFLVREQRRLGKKMSRNHHQHAPPGHREDPRGAVDSNSHPGLAHVQLGPQ